MEESPLETRFRQVLVADRISHANFAPARAEVDGLDARALGRLMADAWHAARKSDPVIVDTAVAVLDRAYAVGPRFDADAALAALRVLAEPGHEKPVRASLQHVITSTAAERPWLVAATVIEGLDVPVDAAMRTLLATLISEPAERKDHPLRVAIAGIAGRHTEVGRDIDDIHRDAPMHRNELHLVMEIATVDARRSCEAARTLMSWVDATDDEACSPPGEYPLAAMPEFVAAGRGWVEQGAAHLAAIQSGAVPFASDQAFAYADAHALARFVNVALDRAEPWLDRHLVTLLLGAALAPDPKVNSAPSQAAAIGIAKAIAQRPTPVALLALKRATAEVRHTGLKKKFKRLLATAERRLALRADLVELLPRDLPVPKALLPAVKRSFEALYRGAVSFGASAFQERILANTSLAEMASRLVWFVRSADGTRTSAMPCQANRRWLWIDVTGGALGVAEDVSIELWHPFAASDAEAEAWRDRIIATRVEQPFNQVFRETYQLDAAELASASSDLFAGHEVDCRSLQGIATVAGWQLARYDGLRLRVGDLVFHFDCGDPYPGMTGTVTTGRVSAGRADGRAVTLGEIDPVLLSEILRHVDLMTSVAAFAVKPPDADEFGPTAAARQNAGSRRWLRPGACGAQRRREVLRRVYGETDARGAPWVEGRHVCVGDVRIHIATGQARRDGELLNLPKPDGVVMLPYSDEVLARIVEQVNVLTGGED